MSTATSYHQNQAFGKMVGRSPAMKAVYETISKVAPGDHTTLIVGASGTGKELVARAIHRLSRRWANPMVTINCGALPENLLESEWFGHCKGAFTGAHRDREGRFARAEGGTLFLDEVGELSLSLQVKLLRVIQFKTFERVGDDIPIQADVRIIAATHRDLKQGVAEGWFREDLFYRLNIVPIVLPRLRDRREDLPLLIDHFFKRITGRGRDEKPIVASQAIKALESHLFPGNVRELENIVERALVLGDGRRIRLADLPEDVRRDVSNTEPVPDGKLERASDLTQALQKIKVQDKDGNIAPWHRRLRCITTEGIAEFLADRGRHWFSRRCLANFMEYRCKDHRSKYKTAGEYLRILRENEICTHNGRKANRSAYRLHRRFDAHEEAQAAGGQHPLPAAGRPALGLRPGG